MATILSLLSRSLTTLSSDLCIPLLQSSLNYFQNVTTWNVCATGDEARDWSVPTSFLYVITVSTATLTYKTCKSLNIVLSMTPYRAHHCSEMIYRIDNNWALQRFRTQLLPQYLYEEVLDPITTNSFSSIEWRILYIGDLGYLCYHELIKSFTEKYSFT